jgi:hypothetical protein
MPRPAEVFRKLDPIAADFARIRWLRELVFPRIGLIDLFKAVLKQIGQPLLRQLQIGHRSAELARTGSALWNFKGMVFRLLMFSVQDVC